MLRKTLLTDGSVGFAFGVAAVIHHHTIRDAAASILYIDLVSIMDSAIHERLLAGNDLKMKMRLKMLNEAGELLDHDRLWAVYQRRTDIAHEWDRGATVDELEKAMEAVQAQLEKWQMIKNIGKYSLEFRQSRKDSSDVQKWAFEVVSEIQIKAGGKVYLELKQTKQMPRVSAASARTEQGPDA